MAYSSLFSAIHDEKHPVGNIGRGSHYSVLSCPQWVDQLMKPHDNGRAEIQKFAVIWDEDHDERVIPIIEAAYIQSLMAPVKFVGERKGHLTVIVDSLFWSFCQNKKTYIKSWESLAGSVSDDYWSCEVRPENEMADAGIIYPDDGKMMVYLQNIDNLWSLGVTPYKTQHTQAAWPSFRDALNK